MILNSRKKSMYTKVIIPVLEYSEIIKGEANIVSPDFVVSEIHLSTMSIYIHSTKYVYVINSKRKVLTQNRVNSKVLTSTERKVLKIVEFVSVTK